MWHVNLNAPCLIGIMFIQLFSKGCCDATVITGWINYIKDKCVVCERFTDAFSTVSTYLWLVKVLNLRLFLITLIENMIQFSLKTYLLLQISCI